MTALVVFRFVHYAAILSLFGISLFRPLLLKGAPQLPALRQRMDPILCVVALLGFLSAIGWLLATSAEMTGSWRTGIAAPTLRTLLSDTSFGRVWAAHVVICLVQLVWWRLPGQRSPVPALALSALAVATLAPVGHTGVSQGLLGTLVALNQLVHLAAVGGWFGALGLLAWIAAQPRGLQPARLALAFGRYGVGLVWAMAISGLINLWLVTGVLIPSAGAYTGVLALKLLAVAGMLALALWHRRHAAMAAPANLRLTLGLEWGCGLLALIAVAFLGTLSPVA
ncbi:CopD family protein [Pseudomonas massiliensis]|uniref:CopD family protein n=1 Tax=Pseudomonas massiliensis TaxID=522492 RepID=UPI00058E4544|nr:CopD family protein [Pseudomonas massiliensis]